MQAESQPWYALAVAYTFLFYLQAIVLVRRIRAADDEYALKVGPVSLGDGRLLGALMALVFDSSLPKDGYRPSLRWHIYLCRIMFVTVPVALVAAVVVPAMGRH